MLQNFKGVGLLSAWRKNLSKGELGLHFHLEDGTRLRGEVNYWKHHRFMVLRLGSVLSFTVREGAVILDDEIGGLGPLSLPISEIRELRSIRD